METQEFWIYIHLDNGLIITYAGEKDFDGLINFLKFNTPTWVKVKDSMENEYIFHTDSVKYIKKVKAW